MSSIRVIKKVEGGSALALAGRTETRTARTPMREQFSGGHHDVGAARQVALAQIAGDGRSIARQARGEALAQLGEQAKADREKHKAEMFAGLKAEKFSFGLGREAKAETTREIVERIGVVRKPFFDLGPLMDLEPEIRRLLAGPARDGVIEHLNGLLSDLEGAARHVEAIVAALIETPSAG
jgi:hypothetical protein